MKFLFVWANFKENTFENNLTKFHSPGNWVKTCKWWLKVPNLLMLILTSTIFTDNALLPFELLIDPHTLCLNKDVVWFTVTSSFFHRSVTVTTLLLFITETPHSLKDTVHCLWTESVWSCFLENRLDVAGYCSCVQHHFQEPGSVCTQGQFEMIFPLWWLFYRNKRIQRATHSCLFSFYCDNQSCTFLSFFSRVTIHFETASHQTI